MTSEARAIRVLFASDTSGHTIGYHVVARGMRDAGFEVILSGRMLPNEAAVTAVQEDVDLLAIRIMDRDPLEYVSAMLQALRDLEAGSMPVLIGGIIAKRDAVKLGEMGIAGVFRPGAKLSQIVESARAAVLARSRDG